MKEKKEEVEHIITEREQRAWQNSKTRSSHHERPSLDRLQRIEFLELVAQMSGRSVFERKLNLSLRDVEFYKKKFDVESPDEARRLARKLKLESDDQFETRILIQTQKAREAERVANARLDALEAKKSEEANAEKVRPDINKIRKEDAERQRRFAVEQQGLEEPSKEWHLPITPDGGAKAEQIDRFRREVIYRGLSFVSMQYSATPMQIKWEAARLGLKINWDIVRR